MSLKGVPIAKTRKNLLKRFFSIGVKENKQKIEEADIGLDDSAYEYHLNLLQSRDIRMSITSNAN